ncbi:MAG: ribonuclease HI family protein, partial [Acidobacteriaceae bacterium]
MFPRGLAVQADAGLAVQADALRALRTRRLGRRGAAESLWGKGGRESAKLGLMFAESGSLFGEAGGGSGSARGRAGSAEWVTAYCDGGSRGNPGPAGFGVFVEGAGGEKLAELSEYLGKTTNNVAEYSGLLAALEWALGQGQRRLRVVSDSELMVKQMQGRYKVNSADLRPLWEEAKRRAARLEGFRIEHVLRGKNQKADRLANLAMDKGTGRGGTGRPGGLSEDSSRGQES